VGIRWLFLWRIHLYGVICFLFGYFVISLLYNLFASLHRLATEAVLCQIKRQFLVDCDVYALAP
jgi:cell division protein FtsX